MTTTIDFSGKRILVVEDDYLLARHLCDELRALGATVVGPAPTAFYALNLLGRRRLDGAILDVRLHGSDVFELADVLQEQRIPMVFATAYGEEAFPLRHRSTPRLTKPYGEHELMSLVEDCMQRPSPPIVVEPPPPLPREHSRSAPDRMALAVARSIKHPSAGPKPASMPDIGSWP